MEPDTKQSPDTNTDKVSELLDVSADLSGTKKAAEVDGPRLFEFIGDLFPPKPRYQFCVKANSTIH